MSFLNATATVPVEIAPYSDNETLIYQFHHNYRLIHGWVSAITCLFGIPCNLLNIIVLTQPNMIKSPTNLILSGLAVADLLTMVTYLPWSIFLHEPMARDPDPKIDTYFISYYLKVHTMICVTLHGISIWFTVYLAVYRYVFLKTASPASSSPTSNRRLKAMYKGIEKFFVQCRSYNSTIVGMILITIFVILFCLPAYLYPEIKPLPYNETDTQDILANISDYKISNRSQRYTYYIGPGKLAEDYKIGEIMFYSQAIFAKLVPCLLLITFTSLLIKSLITINKNKKKLNKTSNYSAVDSDKDKKRAKEDDSPDRRSLVAKIQNKQPKRNRSQKENMRTTIMLIIVCILFLITEFPQCIILLISQLWDSTYMSDVYMPLGDLFDILALLNNSINFLLYCSMSKAFRDTFYKVMFKYFSLCKGPDPPDTTITPMKMRSVNNVNLVKSNNEINKVVNQELS